MIGRRLESIDRLRGLVMVIMALDHVRDMLTAPPDHATDFTHTGAALFFTRWITHLCAPTFVLLAGCSAFLYGAKGRSRAEISRFLLSRGVWLVFIEFTVVSFAWNFNLGWQFIFGAQVIWAIGVSMIALAALLWLPRAAVAGVGLAMILGHNALDGIQPAEGEASAAWILLHIQGSLAVGGLPTLFVYPLIPWIGVMALGYAIGPLFTGDAVGRRRRLLVAGSVLVFAFLALRTLGLYGEPDSWQQQASLSATLVDFFDTTKYPPSLQFLLMTLGPTCLLLCAFEYAKGALADALAVIGRVPFFYYVLHLYVIHLVALAVGVLQGFPIHEIAVIFFRYPEDFGVGLAAVYVAWIAIVLTLYPACRWFAGVKSRRRDWWLSYL